MSDTFYKLFIYVCICFTFTLAQSFCITPRLTPLQKQRQEKALAEYENLRVYLASIKQNAKTYQKELDCISSFLHDLKEHGNNKIYRGLTKLQREELLSRWDRQAMYLLEYPLNSAHQTIGDIERRFLSNEEFKRELKEAGRFYSSGCELKAVERSLESVRRTLEMTEDVTMFWFLVEVGYFWDNGALKGLNPPLHTQILGPCLSP